MSDEKRHAWKKKHLDPKPLLPRYVRHGDMVFCIQADGTVYYALQSGFRKVRNPKAAAAVRSAPIWKRAA